jgi:hypothetical protein
LKNDFTNLKMVIIFVIVYTLSSCVDVSTPLSPTVAIIPPTVEATRIPTETNIPEPTSTQAPAPVIVSDWQQVWSDEFNGTEIDRTPFGKPAAPFA